MAAGLLTGFVGDDEKLTDADRRLIRAARDKQNKTLSPFAEQINKLGVPLSPERLVPGPEDAITGRMSEALARALDKLARLDSAVDKSRPRAADKLETPPAGVSQTTKQLADKQLQEEESGEVVRPNKGFLDELMKILGGS